MAEKRNFVCLSKTPTALSGGIDPPAHLPERKCINIRERAEHEAIIKDATWCEELGIDQFYETKVYLKRWGGWMS